MRCRKKPVSCREASNYQKINHLRDVLFKKEVRRLSPVRLLYMYLIIQPRKSKSSDMMLVYLIYLDIYISIFFLMSVWFSQQISSLIRKLITDYNAHCYRYICNLL